MTRSISAPTIYNAYNARFLTPREVAQTFVPPVQFKRLVERNHSLVLGPRGSGKTTLLMMLQREALDHWTHASAEGYREAVGYTGVFIPADVSWGKQVSSLGDGRLDKNSTELLGRSAFTTHALRRLAVAMEYEVYRSGGLTPQAEAEVASQIAKRLRISDPCASIRALKYALSTQLADLKSIASEEATRGPNGREERLAIRSSLHQPLVEAVSLAVEIFDDALDRKGHKWCLLFDELEIAPDAIRSVLLDSLRSVDERLLFKLSLAPATVDVGPVTDALSATPGNDYSVIPLWYAKKEQAREFCVALWHQMLQERGLAKKEPREVLGKSDFETDSEEWSYSGTAYKPNSRLARRFKSLRGKDESFANFLDKEGISLRNLHKLASDKRSATVRKATSIAAIRDAVIKKSTTEGQRSTLRSREVLEVFSGSSALFAMVEGNPRWFKAIIGELLPQKGQQLRKIDDARQSRALDKAANRFRALLRTVPCPPLQGKQPSRGLLTLLDTIGGYFFKELILKEFTLDPAGTFIVDSRVKSEVVACVATALNTGALVLINDSDDEIPTASLRGKRMRLSYLLAAQFPNLIRIERAINLQTILSRSEPDTKERSTPLFDSVEE